MFYITESDLCYLQKHDGYYADKFMADIVVCKYQESGCKDIFKYISCLFHRLADVENNIWEVRLSDKSIILIKENENGIFIKCLPSIGSGGFNHYFT